MIWSLYMIYIIGGASRSGKSILARELSREISAPYFQLDWLVMGLKNGAPQLEIDDKLWPDEIAIKMWPVLSSIIENAVLQGVDYIFEGEAFLPSKVYNLCLMYPGKIKPIFLGYNAIDLEKKYLSIINYSEKERDWIFGKKEDYIKSHIINMSTFSCLVKDQCQKYGFEYFDTTDDFEESIFLALEALNGTSERTYGTPYK